ncbi:C-C motif chemokine 3-like [Cololabis saira]|uniref:C-C motif chemokine 3-like n=1 Tax=Cololabis saira TaxID=129043 RepID=UPI002AD26988|nr:C-C motif chemokine 3-like [Cololabis saira]
MKAVCFTLGLLLFSVCCCSALRQAVDLSATPGRCCFHYRTNSLPLKFVSDIIKTHSSCVMKGFIVQTVKGRQICYSGTSQWALTVYDQLHKTEGSGQI